MIVTKLEVDALDRDRLKDLWHVVARVVDTRVDGVGSEFVTGIRTKQSRKWFSLLDLRIQPLLIRCPWQNDGPPRGGIGFDPNGRHGLRRRHVIPRVERHNLTHRKLCGNDLGEAV